MKRCMWFDLFGTKVAVYYQEATDTYLIYELRPGKGKTLVAEADGLDPAAEAAMRYCYDQA